jgi:hypothetical protein
MNTLATITVYFQVLIGPGDSGLIEVDGPYGTKQECQQAVTEYVEGQKKILPSRPPVVPGCAAKQAPTNGLDLSK